jgi:2-polyprenyl-3-methyl-5-hydroxy-6-metoxy-1,4-benzoquinol methylase
MKFICKLCGSSSFRPIKTTDAKSKEELLLAFCETCSLIQQESIPSDEELRIYYSHNYRQDYKNTYAPKLKYVRRAGLAAKDRINFLKQNVKIANKSLLDIGAGGGEFVYLASRNGFISSGVEPNEGYSDYAKKEYGVDIQTMMLDKLESASADVVTLFHVFEHMANPNSVMQKIANVLNDDGILFIEVPNILQNDASPHNIFFKAHLFYYSRYSLVTAASRYFEVIKIDDNGNLKALFKKRKVPLDGSLVPSSEEMAITQKRLKNKGWMEYLFIGGGILKPFRRIKQTMLEKNLGYPTPKELLDKL